MRDGAVGVVGETIAWVGARGDRPRRRRARVLTSGARGRRRASSTHAPRSTRDTARGEFERRLRRRDLRQIARGAAASCRRCGRRARPTREALAEQAARPGGSRPGARRRSRSVGYGPSARRSSKQLAVAHALGRTRSASTCARRCSPPTRVPPGSRARRRLDRRVCGTSSAIGAQGLADAVDAFCDHRFTREQTRRVFRPRMLLACR